MAAPYDARIVANCFLRLAKEAEAGLSNLAVLKLLYFAHGWYLVKNDTALIEQEFEAWEHGPVIKVVYDCFKDFKNNIITEYGRRFDLFKGEFVDLPVKIDGDDENFVELIFKEYGRHSAWSLRNMTHEPNSPWDAIWNSKVPVGRFALRIRNADIKEHFLNLPNRVTLF